MSSLFAGDDQPPVRRMEHTPHWLDVLRLVACPQCGSAAGWQCTGARGKARYAHHTARWRALRDALTPAAPLTQWEAYGMLLALFVHTDDGNLGDAVEMEREVGFEHRHEVIAAEEAMYTHLGYV